MSRSIPAFLVFVALFAVAGCTEKAAVTVYKQGQYQGKPDSRPWENAPLAAEYRGGKWTQGDRQSWETQIKTRQLGQHEDKRIY